MIRPSYALKLARTKLRSKRGVLITSIIVASLLFAMLIAIVIVFTGAEKSATEFIKKAGNDRYLVNVQPYIPYETVDISPSQPLDEIRKIKAFEKEYYKGLREKYKTLGIEYDESSEVSAFVPDQFAPETWPEEQRVRTNWQSPVINVLRGKKFEEWARTATNKLSDLKQIGEKYGASGYYALEKPSLLPGIPGTRLVQNGKEDFSVSQSTAGPTPHGSYTTAIYNGGYQFTDQKLLQRYLLPIDTANLKGIPVIASAQEVTSLFGQELGLGKEPKSPKEKAAWLKDIQQKAAGKTYQVCYRNSAELTLLDKIQRDYVEMKQNEKTEGYQKPSLLYEYPKEACGDIIVKADTRSAAEKQADKRAEETQKKLGTYVEPRHRMLTFQIVGVKYSQDFLDYTKSLDEFVKSLLSSKDELQFVLDIPLQLYETLPENLRFDDIQKEYGALITQYAMLDDDFLPRVLEFSTVEQARAFLNKETCSTSTDTCDKKFKASPYGSNYLILDEIGKLFNRIATIAFPAALGLAAIIIWFTISRIMAENRKETAVYRAMGAKRRDVTGIYVVYTLLVALRIAIVSSVLGIAIAFGVDYFYGSTLTDTAVVAFGIIDDAPTFSLFSLKSPLLLVIIVSIFIISLIASAQPLIRNVRRNPIRDMREDG